MDTRNKCITDVKKIAILRANALGDFIFALPALQAIRNRYPKAEIMYLGTEWHRTFLRNRPGPVDRVVVVPKCNGIPDEQDRVENQEEVALFFKEMQEQQLDIAFQMHGGGRHSNPFVLNLGAGLTIGFKTPDAPSLDINVPYSLYQNEVLRFLEVAAKAGAKIENIEPRIAVLESDKQELRNKVKELKKPFVVLHPGASNIQRRWPSEKFASVGDALAEKGLRIFISGTASERELVEEVAGGMKANAENVCGILSIKAFTALLARAEVVISNDTGPLHLARAVGTPTVGIYWACNVVTAGAILVTKNRQCIEWNVNCPLCNMDCMREDVHHPKGTCLHNTSFVNNIAVEEVIENAFSLLATSKNLTP